MSTEFILIFIGVNVVCAAITYWGGVATGTPRWLAFYTAILIGPPALLFLLSGKSRSKLKRSADNGS